MTQATITSKVCFQITENASVAEMDATKDTVKGNLSTVAACLQNLRGPLRTTKASRNSRDPIVHIRANFLGFRDNSGKNMKHMA